MTDIRSTDFAISGYREPRGKDVARSVYVSVVLGLAAWTRPVANAVDQSNAPKRSTQKRLLFGRRVEAVQKASQHIHTLAQTGIRATQPRRGFLPALKDGVSAPEIR